MICCGRLQARHAAVEARNVAELALIGAAARELDAAEEIAVDLGQLIGRRRQLGQRPALLGGQHHLPRRAAHARGQEGEKRLGRVAEFADVQIVEVGIESGQAETEGPPSTASCRPHGRGGRCRGSAGAGCACR